jgi:ribosomal protein S24E
VDVIHPGKPAQSKTEVAKLVAKLHKAEEPLVVLYGFKTAFGGGRSTGFGLIYDSAEDLKKVRRLQALTSGRSTSPFGCEGGSAERRLSRRACALRARHARESIRGQVAITFAASECAELRRRCAKRDGFPSLSPPRFPSRSFSLPFSQFEPKYRLIRAGLATKKTRTRKQWKDQKRKEKRTWGTGRRVQARAAKKAAAS